MKTQKLVFNLIVLGITLVNNLHAQVQRGAAGASSYTDFVVKSLVNNSRELSFLFPLSKKTFTYLTNAGETINFIKDPGVETTDNVLPGIAEKDSVVISSFSKNYLVRRDDNKVWVSDLTGFDKIPSDGKPTNLIEQTAINDTKNIIFTLNQDGTLKVE